MARRITLSTVRRIATLRAAGYSIASIAERVGVSARTVARVCQRFDLRKSDFRAEAIEQARQELLRNADSIELIKAELSALLMDDIAQSRRIRDRMTEAAEHLVAHDLETATQVMRASSAMATALKLLRDLDLNKILDRQDGENLESLPIIEMTASEVAHQRRRALAGNQGGLDDEDELEGVES